METFGNRGIGLAGLLIFVADLQDFVDQRLRDFFIPHTLQDPRAFDWGARVNARIELAGPLGLVLCLLFELSPVLFADLAGNVSPVASQAFRDVALDVLRRTNV